MKMNNPRVRVPRTHLASALSLRIAGSAAVAGIVYVHALDVSSKFKEVPYLGVGYIVLMAACVAAGLMLLLPRYEWQRRGWMLGGLAAAATLTGYTLSRTVGLPHAMDDKGNWGEALGVWSNVAEGAMIVLSAVALAVVATINADGVRRRLFQRRRLG
jgi:hypothetical protein